MDRREFPLALSAKTQLLDALFLCNQDDSEQPYFRFYEREVQNVRPDSPTSSHTHIAALINLVRTSTRAEIEAHIANRLTATELEKSCEIIGDAINLAIRLLLMVSTTRFKVMGQAYISGETKLDWTTGTIKEFCDTELVRPQTEMEEVVKLEKAFNARSLERIGGIKIRWTSNIVDHLRMRDDDKAVEIFHYASFLSFQKCGSLLPAAYIDETLRTLALLLPDKDKNIESWFATQQERELKRNRLPLDPLARQCGQLKAEQRHIKNFTFWHDRLVILKQAYDEAEPNSVKQWWRDRRRKVQWYTFWVAAVVLGLTIFFGLVQSVEGAIQVYYTMNS